MITALVTGKTNPFYGQTVQVGTMTPEGVYPITPVNASEHGWHTGYAREDQLQFEQEQPLSEERRHGMAAQAYRDEFMG